MFAKVSISQDSKKCNIVKSTDIKAILSQVQNGALLILDIDDTVSRVGQTIGTDPWFRYRLAQYQVHHEASAALSLAITLYNLVQANTTHMIQVDKDNDIGELVADLKKRDVKVIGLTARNLPIADKTIQLLNNLGVSFSNDVLREGSFEFKGKTIGIKNGVIFVDGSDKGLSLEHVKERGDFIVDFNGFSTINFVDDSERNCNAVARSLAALGCNATVWHYTFAEENLPFEELQIMIARYQEAHLTERDSLLSDEETQQLYCSYVPK